MTSETDFRVALRVLANPRTDPLRRNGALMEMAEFVGAGDCEDSVKIDRILDSINAVAMGK